MNIGDFEIALRVFDNVLDGLAENRKCVKGNVVDMKKDDAGNAYTYVVSNNVEQKEDGRDEVPDILEDVAHIVYNDPATVVTFSDGTKVCVKACSKDKFDKELGLIYAIVKRLYADDVDDNGYLKASGFGEKIRKLIEGGFDQKEHLAKRKAKKDAARAAKKEAAEKKKTDDKEDGGPNEQ